MDYGALHRRRRASALKIARNVPNAAGLRVFSRAAIAR
jgi:hypothetical protein